ncbi:MAG TPA: hypothetical protein VMT63_07450 [Bacteroidales bacterium]|nr:hypothetical protein [Bacteroidales bacterium]
MGSITLPNLVSIDTSTLVKYLDNSPITAREKDSIIKVLVSDSLIKRVKSYSSIDGESSEYNDYSGYIHLKVFYASTTVKLQHPVVTVSVSHDYAMVGGGAQAYGFTGNGAFLVASRPINDTTWQAQSKDHMIADPHYLEVYAIGMRIDGVDPSYLRARIYTKQVTTTTPAHFPTATAVLPDNYLLVGGGAWDHYSSYGNMLTASYPLSNAAWVGSGKDHRRSDLSTITVYAIGIQNISYPNVGYLQLTYRETTEPAPPGQQFCFAPVWDGYALTCPGGYCTYTSIGRMLVSLYPSVTPPVAQMSSKDTSGDPDTGNNYAYGYGIEKRPY